MTSRSGPGHAESGGRLRPSWPWFALAALGCASETGIVAEPLPSWPDSKARPPAVTEQVDRILQVTVPRVDVLWCVDNSSSMADEQDALVQAFPAFADWFVGSGLDYHIGVVTTDIENPAQDGSLHGADGEGWIDPESPTPIETFARMATLGTEGSGDESGMGAVYHALEQKRDTVNTGFYREDAELHVVVISDEEDQTPASVVTPAEFVPWFRGLKAEGVETTFSSIVSFVDAPPADRGERYLGLTHQIGGTSWDITDPDWTEVLDALGLQAGGYHLEFFLSQRPVPETITVSEERTDGVVLVHERAVLDDAGVVVSGAWSWDPARNSVSFHDYVPEPLSAIVIRYVLLAAEQE